MSQVMQARCRVILTAVMAFEAVVGVSCATRNCRAAAGRREVPKGDDGTRQLLETCQRAWAQAVAQPKGLQAEGSFTTTANGKEIAKATFKLSARGDRYRADMTFADTSVRFGGNRVVAIRDPGAIFFVTKSDGILLGNGGKVQLMEGFLIKEQIPGIPPAEIALPVRPSRPLMSINLADTKAEDIAAAKTRENGDIELHYQRGVAAASIICSKNHGYNVAKVEAFRDKIGGTVAQSETAKWKRQAGVWVPEEVTSVFNQWTGKEVKLEARVNRVTYSKYDANVIVDESEFSLDSLDIRDGTRIQDLRPNARVREHRYRNGQSGGKTLGKAVEELPGIE